MNTPENPLEHLGADDLRQAWDFYIEASLSLRAQLERVLNNSIVPDNELQDLLSDANLFLIAREDPNRVLSFAWVEAAITLKGKLTDGLIAYEETRKAN